MSRKYQKQNRLEQLKTPIPLPIIRPFQMGYLNPRIEDYSVEKSLRTKHWGFVENQKKSNNN